MNLTFQVSDREYLKMPYSFILLSGIILSSLVITPFHESENTVCLFKNILGIPCPICGMTRAFLFLGHGDIYEAVGLNILSPLVFSIVVILWLYSVIRIFIGNDLVVRLTQRERFLIYFVIGGLVITGWAYNLFLNPYL